MNKTALIKKIKSLEGLTNAEKSDLINLLNQTKKYGLVWEDKPEDVEELLRTQLPVLVEVPERRILAKDLPQAVNSSEQSKPVEPTLFDGTETDEIELTSALSGGRAESRPAGAPNHILIEGDNLHALTALSFTHEGKIDVIYIDPPYNTGKENEFRYNDKWVDGEDNYRHSKWLSFMRKRLEIAYKLLSASGVIFISIDDNEIAQLKILCDELFDKNNNPKNSNLLGILIWDLGTGTSAGHFTRSNEFILAYSKNRGLFPNFSGGDGIIDDRAQKKISSKNRASDYRFPAGTKFEAPDNFELSGTWGGQERTTLVQGRFICEEGKLKEDIVLNAGWTQKKQMDSFFIGEETIDSKGQKVIEFYFRNNGKIYCRKERDKINPPTVLRNIATTKQGSSIIKSIFFGEEPIKFTKPIQLIQYLIGLLDKELIICDFFAGSGTTLHATMQLNSEDGGNRQCILVTNNENNIAEEVCYQRNKRVIKGYTNDKGAKIPGLTRNNLRYYKTGFVASARTEANRRLLTSASSELLQIKEDCYTEITAVHGFDAGKCRIYTNGAGKYLVIVYHSRRQQQVIGQLCGFIQNLEDLKEKVRVYAFSPETEVLMDDFYPVADKIVAVPLPDAIYNAYRATFRTLKLDKKPVATKTGEPAGTGAEDSEPENQPELFDTNGED